jgi:acyl carrier protein
MSDARAPIRAYILRELAPDLPGGRLEDDTALFGPRGVIDSLAIITLVAFLDQRFGFRIEAHEITEQHFHSVDALVRFVDAKRGLDR